LHNTPLENSLLSQKSDECWSSDSIDFHGFLGWQFLDVDMDLGEKPKVSLY
jgi:hypothetical protein